MAQTPIYTPPSGLHTRLDDFRDYFNKKHNLRLRSYNDLHNFSVTRLNDFWMAVWNFTGIKASRQPSKAIADDARIVDVPEFFEDARLNYAENMLRGEDDAVALIEMNEQNLHSPRKYTWKDLRTLVAKYVGILQRTNIQQGDVIVLIGGNSPRSLAFLLAAAAIGAIFASFATDIGEKSLIDRINQLKPKIMIAELRYHYNGTGNDIRTKIEACLESLKPHTACQLIVTSHNRILPDKSLRLGDLLGNEKGSDLKFAQLPFSTPFILMFSSGTTGTPKGILHSQGGLTLNGIKDHMLHRNFGADDIHFHYSGTGWTLWNISIGAMFCKTAMVLYDGSPFYPSCDEFLKAVFATGVTGYGGSPRYFSELQKRGVKPRAYATKMHTLLSTGALLTPGTANWLAEAFGPVCQINFTGGTELCGNFMSGTRTMPSYAGELAVKELGMNVDAFSPNGKSLSAGESGELVCKKPFPNMPVALWNDPKKERYNKSYFNGFPGVWTHGDLIRTNPTTNGTYVLGRSDGVLNPSGVRFGTSELYNVLSSSSLSSIVLDGLAIGQQRTSPPHSDATERVILFLKVAPEHSTGTPFPKPEIVDKIKQGITKDLSRRHVPSFFFEVDEIPHNANTKKMEIQVKQVCNGGKVALDKMTLTDAERGMLNDYVRFHDVDEVVRQKRESKL